MNPRFNPPPNWPKPPENWTPPPGWAPDPNWGPMPSGWPLWVEESSQGGRNDYASQSASPYAPSSVVPQSGTKKRTLWVVIPLIVLVLFVGCSLVISSLGSTSAGSQLSSKKQDPVSQEEIDAAPELNERDFALLVKSPDQHEGETIVLYARISQFDAATGECIFRANVAHQRMQNSWDYGENALFTGQGGEAGCRALDGFVAEDEVRIVATSLGSVSYETQIRGNTTVPAFRIEKIEAVTPG